jgi:hypothetical protein
LATPSLIAVTSAGASPGPGAVYKNGTLIERPDESEGGDQQVA